MKITDFIIKNKPGNVFAVGVSSLYIRKVCFVMFSSRCFKRRIKKQQRGTEWHDNYIRVMRKERGPNTRISFPTHKREKGHNNQGRKYLL